MIDPSSLLYSRARRQLFDLSGDEAGAPTFVPASFVRSLHDTGLFPSVSRYFGPRTSQTEIAEILELLQTRGLQTYQGDQVAPASDTVARGLTRLRDRVVRDILLEEWTFLARHSWIIARKRKAFDAFRRAGAVVVDFSGQKFDEIVARTLHHDRLPIPPELTSSHRIRAAAKWIAAGGIPVMSLADPVLAAIASAGTGVFFLFDP
jgi:hypothetical protein